MSEEDIFWIRTVNTQLLDYIACTKNLTVIVDYLNQLKRDYYKEQDSIIIFHSIIVRHAKNNLMLHYILQNFATVIPR